MIIVFGIYLVIFIVVKYLELFFLKIIELKCKLMSIDLLRRFRKLWMLSKMCVFGKNSFNLKMIFSFISL